MSQHHQTMQVFRWQGRTKQGHFTHGKIHSTSIEQATKTLKKQGIITTQLSKNRQWKIATRPRIQSKEIRLFTRQLSSLLDAGISLNRALSLIQSSAINPALAELIAHLIRDLHRGQRFSEALRQHPTHFHHVYCQLVESAEQTGTLDLTLKKMADQLEKTAQLKQKIAKAMWYPSMVLITCLTLTALLMIGVVPQFESLFANYHSTLPTITRVLLGLSHGLQQHWLSLLGVIVGTALSLRIALQRNRTLKHQTERAVLKLWLIGSIVRKGTTARIARSLATQIQAGIPLLDALASSAHIANNAFFAAAIDQVIVDIKTGKSLAQSVSECGLFSDMTTQMIRIGEESGTLDTLLEKIAHQYETDIDTTLNSLSSMIEPLIMLVLGVIVGTMVLALYLPIFKLSTVF